MAYDPGQQPYGGQPQPFGNQPFANQPQSYGGQTQPYGNQPQSYGDQPQSYGGQPQQPGRPGAPDQHLASWGQRAGAYLLDALLLFLALLPGAVLLGIGAAADSDGSGPDEGNVPLIVLGVLLMLAGLGFQLWNQGWRQGARGQSFGKQWLGIRLVSAQTGTPPGGGTGLGRLLLRSVLGNCTQGLYSLLTFLWPLWDDRRQTLDDKIFKTLVVRQ